MVGKAEERIAQYRPKALAGVTVIRVFQFTRGIWRLQATKEGIVKPGLHYPPAEYHED